MGARRSLYHGKDAAILKAAGRLFLKHGYAKTSMDAVAREAGVTKQTVYTHFKSKEGLFLEMVAAMCKKHTPSEAILSDEHKPINVLLYQVGKGFLELISSREGLGTTCLVMSEAAHRPRLAQMFYDTGPGRMQDIIASLLQKQQAKGVIEIGDSKAAAAYFYAMLKGPYQLRMALRLKPQPTKKELDTHVQETVKRFLKMYQ